MTQIKESLTNPPLLKTELQTERENRDLAIYRDYTAMMAVQGQSKTRVNEYLMNKYNIHSQGTIYVIIARVEKRLQEEKK